MRLHAHLFCVAVIVSMCVVSARGEDLVLKIQPPDIPSLRAAAEKGDGQAMFTLGKVYEAGWGVRLDEKEALGWYQKSADTGNLEGINQLGVFHAQGKGGIPADPRKAVEWFRKAADAGSAKAMSNLGHAFARGKGVAQDEAQAIDLWKKAAEAGEPLAYDALGSAYAAGRGVKADPAEAERLLRLAESNFRQTVQAGDVERMLYLAGFYFRNPKLARHPDEAMTLLRAVADAGRTDAMRGVAFFYGVGIGTIPKNLEESFKWHLKAAENGEPVSMFSVAIAYEKGEGVAADAEKAKAWYQKSAEAGNASAKAKLEGARAK